MENELIKITTDENGQQLVSAKELYLGLERKDNAPGMPSSILAKVCTRTSLFPTISPWSKSAICFAENSIKYNLNVLTVMQRKT